MENRRGGGCQMNNMKIAIRVEGKNLHLNLKNCSRNQMSPNIFPRKFNPLRQRAIKWVHE